MSKKYYIDFDETKVYDVSGLHENDPVRLCIEVNEYIITHEMLEEEKEELIKSGEYEFDKDSYNSIGAEDGYACYDDFLYFPDIERKKELIDNCIDLATDEKEYNMYAEMMKKDEVYDSYAV